MYKSLHLFKKSFNRYWLLGLIIPLCYAPTGWGQEQSEIDELKTLLNQTQEVMKQQLKVLKDTVFPTHQSERKNL
jgi:hypothetical protein